MNHIIFSNSITINYFGKSVFAVKMTVKKLSTTCNRLFSCKSTLNQQVKVFRGSDHQQNQFVRRIDGERRQDKKEPKNYYTLKLCVTVKKFEHEIKTILQDAAVLLKINMGAAFQKAEMVDRQVLIHCNRQAPKTLHRAQRFLGPMVNLLKISFESKTAGEILLVTKLRKKCTTQQKTVFFS